MPTIKQFHVVGRKTPTEADPTPSIYRMRIFAPNEVVAKSRYWCVPSCELRPVVAAACARGEVPVGRRVPLPAWAAAASHPAPPLRRALRCHRCCCVADAAATAAAAAAD
jgi:hypothetical protein